MRAVAVGVTPYRPTRRHNSGFGRMIAATLTAALLAACAPQPQTITNVVRPGGSVAGAGASVDVTRPVPVTVLLPLSSGDSEAQAIARDMADATQLAAAGPEGNVLDLQVRDSGGNPATAASLAQQAIAQGAALVLGPAFAEEAQSVTPVARESGVTMLAFSSFARYAAPPLYIMGLTPEDEVERIFAYAASQGLSRIALVLPLNNIGAVFRDASRTAAARYGLNIVYILDYPYTQEGSAQAIRDQGGALAAAQPDAVFVPEDNGGVLTWILSFLALDDVRSGQQQLLGSARWVTGGGLRAPELVGGWYPALDPAALDAFNSRFEASYGRRPRLEAVVAYDATRAAAELVAQARRSGSTSPFAPAAVTAQAGFEGATGRFRLRPDGRVTRDFVIMEIGPSGPVMRAPAAPSGS